MWRSHLAVALRGLLRHRLVSAINIAGLSTALAVCVLALLFVRHETAYDAWHEKADRICVVVMEEADGERRTLLSEDMRATIREDLPGVANTAHLRSGWVTVAIGQETFQQGVNAVDPAFLDIFTFPLVSGNPATALTRPDGVVLTHDVAHELYGSEDPTGTMVSINGAERVVTGVMAPTPETSSFYFGMLVPAAAAAELRFGRGIDAFFVEREATADEEDLARGVMTALSDRLGESTVLMVPLKDVHTTKVKMAPIAFGRGKTSYSYILISIAAFVLIISCANFVILAMARAYTRIAEIGVRKAVGAARRQLISQILAEAALVTLAAIVGGVALAEALLPSFNAVTGVEVELELMSRQVLLGGICLLVTVALLAGVYPAVAISRLQPGESLKGEASLQGSSRPGRTLIVVQFALSTVLVIVVMAMHSQMELTRTQDLGFDDDRILYAMGDFDEMALQRLSVALERSETVQSVAGVSGAPGFGSGEGMVEINGQRTVMRPSFVSPGFVATMGMRIVAGRDLDPGNATDPGQAILLNESAAQALGGIPVGATVETSSINGMESSETTVIGIVEDYHYDSMRESIGPACIRLKQDSTMPWEEGVRFGVLMARIDPMRMAQARADLLAAWQHVGSGKQLETRLLEERFRDLYGKEERWGKVIGVSSAMAMVIACMGLFGLATLVAQRRTRELGIRKVLGTTVASILALMSREFAWLVLAANVVAWPIAYYVLERWLQNYAYRIQLGPVLFGVAGAAVLAVAMVTVSGRAWHSACANPVDALRQE